MWVARSSGHVQAWGTGSTWKPRGDELPRTGVLTEWGGIWLPNTLTSNIRGHTQSAGGAAGIDPEVTGEQVRHNEGGEVKLAHACQPFIT